MGSFTFIDFYVCLRVFTFTSCGKQPHRGKVKSCVMVFVCRWVCGATSITSLSIKVFYAALSIPTSISFLCFRYVTGSTVTFYHEVLGSCFQNGISLKRVWEYLPDGRVFLSHWFISSLRYIKWTIFVAAFFIIWLRYKGRTCWCFCWIYNYIHRF